MFLLALPISAKIIIKISALTKAAPPPTIKSLEVSGLVIDELAVNTQAPSWNTVPGPHLPSKTQAPFFRTVPGPHCVLGSVTSSGSSTTVSGSSGTSSGTSSGADSGSPNAVPNISSSSVPDANSILKVRSSEVVTTSSNVGSSKPSVIIKNSSSAPSNVASIKFLS